MKTSKTLAESINDVMNSKMSKTAKRAALIKLGLTRQDTYYIIDFAEALNPTCRPFNAGSLTFGVEIECSCNQNALITEGARRGLHFRYEGYTHRDYTDRYKLVHDGSVRGDYPVEAVSPILKGRNGRKSLKTFCEALNAAGATVNRSCGFHVHIGAQSLADQHYINIFHNYAMCQEAIDKFMAPSRRGGQSQWCQRIDPSRLVGCNTKVDVARALHNDRYHAVNPCAYDIHKTVEFRQHAGTVNYGKMILWLDFLQALISYSANNRLTERVTELADLPFADDRLKARLAARAAELNR